MGRANLAKRESVGCLKLLGFEGSSSEVALGNGLVVFTTMHCGSQSSWPASLPPRSDLLVMARPRPDWLRAPGQLVQ